MNFIEEVKSLTVIIRAFYLEVCHSTALRVASSMKFTIIYFPRNCPKSFTRRILPILVGLPYYIAIIRRRDQCLFVKFSLNSSGSN